MWFRKRRLLGLIVFMVVATGLLAWIALAPNSMPSSASTSALNSAPGVGTSRVPNEVLSGQVPRVRTESSPEWRDVSIGVAANFSEFTHQSSPEPAHFMREAVQLAIDHAKPRLDAKKVRLSLRTFDYSADKAKAMATAEEALSSNVIAVVGYLSSTYTLLAGPIFQRNRLLLVTPASTADRIETLGPYVRRVCFSDADQGKALARLAKQRRIRRVAIVSVADCAYCQSLRNAFLETFLRDGGILVSDVKVLQSDVTFPEAVAALREKRLDAVFVPNHERMAATLISYLYDAGIRPRHWLGGDAWHGLGEVYASVLGHRKIQGFHSAHWDRTLETSAAPKFVAAFAKSEHSSFYELAALSYDAASYVIEGILQAPVLSRQGVVDALDHLTHWQGVTGEMRFAPGRRTPEKGVVMMRIENNVARPMGTVGPNG